MAVEYAKEREQFGRPIGAYQAVSHRLADMLWEVEEARSLTYYAAWAADAEPETLPLAASMAKARASDAATAVTHNAIQTLGGIGFTWEHDVHFFLKRARVGAQLLGTPRQHRERVAALAGLGDRRCGRRLTRTPAGEPCRRDCCDAERGDAEPDQAPVADRLELGATLADLDVAERRDDPGAAPAPAAALLTGAAAAPEPPARPGDRDHGHPLALDRLAEHGGRLGARAGPLRQPLDDAVLAGSGRQLAPDLLLVQVSASGRTSRSEAR